MLSFTGSRPRPITLCISTDTRDPAFSNRHSPSGPTVGTLWTFPSEISSCEWVGEGDLGRWKGQDEKTVKRTVTIVYNHLQGKLVLPYKGPAVLREAQQFSGDSSHPLSLKALELAQSLDQHRGERGSIFTAATVTFIYHS